MVPGTRLYPPVPPLPVLSSLKPDHLLSAVAAAYALRADGGRVLTRSMISEAAGSTPSSSGSMPDHELWMAFFRDPDWNLHGPMAEVRG